MDDLWIAVLSALAGAASGSFGAWLTTRLRDRERDSRGASEGLREKVHHIELRIVRLETEFSFYAAVAAKRFEGVGDA